MIEILTLILGSLMLIATFIYVYFTYKLTQETTKLREIETSPFINAKLIIEAGFSKIYIENIGKSPAYDLNIKFEEETFKTIKSDCYKTYMSNIVYFGVGQVMDIGFRTQILMDLDKEIVLNVTYSSKDNQKFSEIIHLSLGAEKDFGVFYPKSEYEDEFKKLTKELENIGKYVEKLTENNNSKKSLTKDDLERIRQYGNKKN
jgi:hypothetical protein